ncbi:hypothetical protein H114_32629 [Streptomyces gancidicus BKS 13-15]|uniref:Uncharacterized protein n=1 Tax=Streptomyces gancidicus BKS 13-15 TaxID=1284664 RepID=M3DFH3_STREZ|nr:hypothetical protein [Streptomyces gancidicus]EMF20387.1 hypothetical protein H114_32629 [Streptomyces gancidicus BKS 13-15]
MSRTIRIRTTEDAVAVVAALATQTIAAARHGHHTTDYVGAIMTSDEVLDKIRTAYERHTAKGLNPREAITAVGQTVVASYCDRAGIPTA